MKGVKNVVGPRLKLLRKEQGFTQDALVAKLHLEGLEALNRISISKIESQVRNVTDYELQIIAHVLKVTPNDLYPPYSYVSQNIEEIRRPM